MCVVSNMGDTWINNFPQRWPTIDPITPQISREEFDSLKKEVQELKLLLEAAKRYDRETGQPDCEMEDKVALIKKIADLVGVDMGTVFNKEP